MPTASRLWTSSLLIGATLTCFVVGCGGSGFATVTGKVVFPDKTPLSKGNVVFSPADSGTMSAQGVIQEDGSFRLGTRTASDGAPPGKYRVAIEPYEDKAGPVIDRRFEDPKLSGLEYTVVAGSNDFTITVDRPKKKR